MKNLSEIKDEVAKEHLQVNWSNMMHKYGGVGDTIFDKVAKRYAEECAIASLEKAGDKIFYYVNESGNGDEAYNVVNNPENIVLP